VLSHLNLIQGDRITNAAILLFGKNPQKFFISSEIKCALFHGYDVIKPIPSYQVYKGDVFQLITQAAQFVLSNIHSTTGTRDKGVQVDVNYELPIAAVTEAIVNAAAHRDYTSNGSIQVMLFKNRLEVWNPGRLPHGMTIEKLKQYHSSIPVNPLLAEPMYLNGTIERMGTGTRDMVKLCLQAGLKEPEFEQEEFFRTVLWRKDLSKNSVKTSPNTIKTGGQTGGQTLSEIQERIVALMVEKPTISRKEISKNLKINASAIQKHIEKLKQQSIIHREGADFGGSWKVKNEGAAKNPKIKAYD
jgi:predicted HTH transcriptional regulator